MLLSSLRQLEPVDTRTVVINVNTDLVATRAVLSALDVARYPVLLVNSQPTDSGRKVFERLLAERDFDLIEVPLREHGVNLDWLFSSLRDDHLLLLDSDAEIIKSSFVEWMRNQCRHPSCFGAGFTWGPYYLPPEWGAPKGKLLYMERPWLPCAMFKRTPVHQALDEGASFRHKAVPNDIAVSPMVSRFLAARWPDPWKVAISPRFEQLPWRVKQAMSTWQLDWLKFTRFSFHGQRPSVAVYDTAAALYQYLRYEKELLFAGTPFELLKDEVHHYSGVTRHAMLGPTLLATDEKSIEDEVVARLAERYGYQWHQA